jgi:prepilin-type N-terminal cleavage/methylation domain-containing protein
MNRGFTLIELILVIVIAGIVGGFTLAFVSESVKTYRIMQAQSVLYQEATYALERITRELRDASTTPTVNGGLAFRKSHSTEQDGNLFVRYYLRDGLLYRCSDSAEGAVCNSSPTASPTNKPLASNVHRFESQLGSTNAITTIHLELQSDELNARVSLSTSIIPQNCTNFNGDWQDVIR